MPINSQEFITTVLLNCLFYLQGKHLRCSNAAEVKSVYLPLGDKNKNYSLSVVVTVRHKDEKVTTNVSTQVCERNSNWTKQVGRVKKMSLSNLLRLLMFLKVRKSSSSSSVEALTSAVEDTMSQLEQQGLLSGEALGQIFTSVSDMLNTGTSEEQKDERTKVTG